MQSQISFTGCAQLSGIEMDLATQQRKLLGLFRSTYEATVEDDPYIRRVARSRDLAEGKKNIALWRVWVFERTCALTVNLLRRRNLLNNLVKEFITAENISPFRETQAPAFLEWLEKSEDHLLASVASFELALMRVREGDQQTHIISWTVEPASILHCLAKDLPFGAEMRAGQYQTIVSSRIPGHFEIFELMTATSRAESR